MSLDRSSLSLLTALVANQAKGIGSVTQLALQLILQLYSNNSKWYDQDLVIARAARASEIMDSAQRATRRQVQAYQRQVFRVMDLPFPDVNLLSEEELNEFRELDNLYPRNGVTPLDVWNRPAEQFRFARSIEKASEEAQTVSVQRAQDLVETDVTLAARQEFARIMRATPTIIGYRRVIHPELTKSGTCGLCIAASTRTYDKRNLLPIHDHCVCTVLPYTDQDDPGDFMNRQDLDALYAAAGGTGAQELSRIRVKEFEHGELGTILVPQKSTPRKVVKPTPISRRESIEAQLDSLSDSLARLRARPDDVSEAVAWQRTRISTLERELNELENSVPARRG